MDRLTSPACEHLICMMMSRMVMVMMIVITAAVMVVMMMVLMSLMFVIVMVLVSLMLMVVVMVMPLVMVIMPAALAVVVVSAALRADHFRQKFLLKGFTGLHCLQDLFARKLCDGSRDERSLVIKFTEQSHSLFHLLRFCLVRTA